MRNQFDIEREQLEHDYQNDLITSERYAAEHRLIDRAERDEAFEAAREAHDAVYEERMGEYYR